MAAIDITGRVFGCRETVLCWVPDRDGQWSWEPVDRCLAPLVTELTLSRVFTTACCCGHGQAPGTILIEGGRAVHLPVCQRYRDAVVTEEMLRQATIS